MDVSVLVGSVRAWQDGGTPPKTRSNSLVDDNTLLVIEALHTPRGILYVQDHGDVWSNFFAG